MPLAVGRFRLPPTLPARGPAMPMRPLRSKSTELDRALPCGSATPLATRPRKHERGMDSRKAVAEFYRLRDALAAASVWNVIQIATRSRVFHVNRRKQMLVVQGKTACCDF